AHPSPSMAPLPALAVDLAEYVMQQHVRGSGRVGTLEIPDHRVETERRLDRRRLEPAVQDLARALGEKIHDGPARGEIESAEAPRQLHDIEHRDKVVAPVAHIGWRDVHELPQH